MPKVPWRVGRVVNKGSLTSLLRTSALMIGARDQPRGESGESAPGLSVSRSPAGAIDRPAPLLSRLWHEVGIVVKGDGRRRVPRPLGEGDDRLSRLRDEERACVPQHVERVLRYGLPLPCLRSPSLLVSAVVITPLRSGRSSGRRSVRNCVHTIAIDVAARAILAAVPYPDGTQATDAAPLLAEMAAPHPARPSWPDGLLPGGRLRSTTCGASPPSWRCRGRSFPGTATPSPSSHRIRPTRQTRPSVV